MIIRSLKCSKTSVRFFSTSWPTKEVSTIHNAKYKTPHFNRDIIFNKKLQPEIKQSVKYIPKVVMTQTLNSILSQYDDRTQPLSYKAFSEIVSDVNHILNYKGKWGAQNIPLAISSINLYYRQVSVSISSENVLPEYLAQYFTDNMKLIKKFTAPIINNIIEGNLKVSSSTLLNLFTIRNTQPNLPVLIHNAIRDAKHINHHLYRDPQVISAVINSMLKLRSPVSKVIKVHNLAKEKKPQPDLTLLHFYLTKGLNIEALQLFKSFIEAQSSADRELDLGTKEATKAIFMRHQNPPELLGLFNSIINEEIPLKLSPRVARKFIEHLSSTEADIGIDTIADLTFRYLAFYYKDKDVMNYEFKDISSISSSIFAKFFSIYPLKSPEGIEKLKDIIQQAHDISPFILPKFIPELFSNKWHDQETLNILVSIGKSYGIEENNSYFYYHWLKALASYKKINFEELEIIFYKYSISLDRDLINSKPKKLPLLFFKNMIDVLLKNGTNNRPQIEFFFKLWKTYLPYATPKAAISPLLSSVQLNNSLRRVLTTDLKEIDTSSIILPAFENLSSDEEMIKIIGKKIKQLQIYFTPNKNSTTKKKPNFQW